MAFLSFCILVTGCGSQNKGLPLPQSAKIEVPFPYAESSNGEQWLLNRDPSNHFVVQVINANKVEATFSVDSTNGNYPKKTITLGGQTYIIQHITVNNGGDSGFVTLSKEPD